MTPDAARLSARPDPTLPPPGECGLLPLNLGSSRDGLLYVPEKHPLDGPRPLLVACHGAGSQASHSIRPFVDAAERYGLILLACDSRGGTWDVIRGGYGPDVQFIDRALELVFSRCAIDPQKLALDGFSDGASYALSLALVGNNLSRVAVVGRDQDQRVRVLLGEGQCTLQGFVELLELADGSAGVPSVGLLVNGRGLDHQEEAIGILVAELE